MADLDDLQARYGVATEPITFPIAAADGTSDVVAIVGVANRRIYVELVDLVSNAAIDLGIIRGASTPVWGPIPAAQGLQYTASGILGGLGESISITRGSSAQIGGGGTYRLLGPPPA